jgi:hypothetical protein
MSGRNAAHFAYSQVLEHHWRRDPVPKFVRDVNQTLKNRRKCCSKIGRSRAQGEFPGRALAAAGTLGVQTTETAEIIHDPYAGNCAGWSREGIQPAAPPAGQGVTLSAGHDPKSGGDRGHHAKAPEDREEDAEGQDHHDVPSRRSDQ